MTTTGLGNSASSFDSRRRRFATTAVATATVFAVFGSYRLLSTQFEQRLQNPRYGLLDFHDQSASFSAGQFRAQLAVGSKLYEAIFGGEPVEVQYAVFGQDLQECATGVTTSKEQALRLFNADGRALPTATRFSLLLNRAHALASGNRARTFVVLIQSDGQATDIEETRQAASELAADTNVGLVVVTGALPQYRLSLRQLLAPLGSRLAFLSVVEASNETLRTLSERVHHPRGLK
ncbi:MAG: hypothetical protein KIS66_06230 [Fimbriimonadaceae bacterium]|nr:hypothetical protein [Fimbriimonadaceae bacterium]